MLLCDADKELTATVLRGRQIIFKMQPVLFFVLLNGLLAAWSPSLISNDDSMATAESYSMEITKQFLALTPAQMIDTLLPAMVSFTWLVLSSSKKFKISI